MKMILGAGHAHDHRLEPYGAVSPDESDGPHAARVTARTCGAGGVARTRQGTPGVLQFQRMRSTDRFSIENVRCDVGGISHPVANLSLGGFFLACEPPLPVGHSVAFDLVFADGWRVPAVGRVAWVNGQIDAKPELPTGCGITITRIAFPDKLALVDRLRRASAVADPRR